MIDKQLQIGIALVFMGAPKNEAMCLAARVTLIGGAVIIIRFSQAHARVRNVKVLWEPANDLAHCS